MRLGCLGGTDPNCRRPHHVSRTPYEEQEIEDTVASIRLRTRYNDPYEDWERQTRLEALVRSNV